MEREQRRENNAIDSGHNVYQETLVQCIRAVHAICINKTILGAKITPYNDGIQEHVCIFMCDLFELSQLFMVCNSIIKFLPILMRFGLLLNGRSKVE